jgi:hypothetical protein
MYGPKTEIGLGGARTHNQRLKRAIVTICKILVISILQMRNFLLLTILKKPPRRQETLCCHLLRPQVSFLGRRRANPFLSPCWIGRTAVHVARWSRHHRRAEAEGICRPWRRAHNGAGPTLCVAFLSMSRSRHSQRRSLLQRPLCFRSISFIGLYEARECGISEPIRSSIEPGNFA